MSLGDEPRSDCPSMASSARFEHEMCRSKVCSATLLSVNDKRLSFRMFTMYALNFVFNEDLSTNIR